MILPRARLRQVAREQQHARPRELADLRRDVLQQLAAQLVGLLDAVAGDHERADLLALDRVVGADRGRLGDGRVLHEARLDLGGRDAVAGDVDHVVDAAHQPEVAVGVGLRAVAGEVHVAAEPAPVGLHEAVVVAPERAQHGRPRALQHQVAAAAARHLGALLVDDHRRDARQRVRGRTGLRGRDARQRRDHDRARLGLPPRVDDRAAAAADALVVPHPRLGVDRLADRAQQAQARQVVLCDVLVAGLHERADGGRRRVVDADAVALDDLPVPRPRRVLGRALVHDAGGVVRERAVDDVRVAGHPAAVGGAPVDVVGADVEHPLVGHHRAEQVAGRGVADALRLRGRAARVEQVEHVLGAHRLGLALGGGARHGVVPPDVAALGPRHLVLGPPHDQHVVDRRAVRRPPRPPCPSAARPGRAATRRRT